jgi:hypothetical protein
LHLYRTALVIAFGLLLAPTSAAGQPVDIRVATFNIEDLRTHELVEPGSPRVRHAAEIIQRLRPNVVLVNEITFDQPGAPGHDPGDPTTNADRLAALLATEITPGVPPLAFNAWSAPSNTGLASGFDLDRSGEVAEVVPPQPAPNPDGSPVTQTAAGRAYGGDAWGFGTFPGQYAMALLVDERLTIDRARARTFRLFPWSAMPGGLVPYLPEADDTATDPESERGELVQTEPYYTAEQWELFRLSSKSHWDIPVRLPNGATVHILASHPTPPAFDGPEQRNKKRNHDEIRFWADYVDNASYIVDDAGRPGGLPVGQHFVIVGDLNADPEAGSSLHNPIANLLLRSRHVAPDPRPASALAVPGLNATDTALFGLRVDYALPSRTLTVLGSGVWRYPPAGAAFPSDHFPVWVDLRVPAPAPPGSR